MSVLDRVSLSDQIAEVKREIEQRKMVYARQIDKEKMTKAEAERRMLAMCGVLQTLEGVRDMGTNNNIINGDAHDSDRATATMESGGTSRV